MDSVFRATLARVRCTKWIPLSARAPSSRITSSMAHHFSNARHSEAQLSLDITRCRRQRLRSSFLTCARQWWMDCLRPRIIHPDKALWSMFACRRIALAFSFHRCQARAKHWWRILPMTLLTTCFLCASNAADCRQLMRVRREPCTLHRFTINVHRFRRVLACRKLQRHVAKAQDNPRS